MAKLTRVSLEKMQQESRERHKPRQKDFYPLFIPEMAKIVDIPNVEETPDPTEKHQLPLLVLVMDEVGVCEIGPDPIKAFSPAPDHYDGAEGSALALDEVIFWEGPPPKKRLGRPPGSKTQPHSPPEPVQKKEIDWEKLKKFLAGRK